MEKAKVYYTDFRAKIGEGLPTKLKRLIKAAVSVILIWTGNLLRLRCISENLAI